MKLKNQPLWLVKLTRYEFWPVNVFYCPFFFYWIYLGLKAQNLAFLFNINPAMILGGAVGAGKKEALDHIPVQYKPKTIFFEPGCGLAYVKELMAKELIALPCIAKPNEGERGQGVEKIASFDDLERYVNLAIEPFLIQEFVDSTQELGVFYYKDPVTEQGQITSIVVKNFLSIKGNGQLNLEQLMQQNLRARFRINYLRTKFKNQLNRVLDQEEILYLEPIGNHCRGTEFMSGNHLINAKLVAVFDKITKDFIGFDYGRFDLKISDLNSLYKGKDIRILEVNGVNAEPAHIYDTSYNLIKAYKDVKKQLDIIYRIYDLKYRHRKDKIRMVHCIPIIKEHLKIQKRRNRLLNRPT